MTTFDPERQAELARVLELLDARPRLDQAELFSRAARTLPPPPAVARVLEGAGESESDQPDPG